MDDKQNTGNLNTGDWNTGDLNAGDMNTGDRNTGDWNTGNLNTGNLNTGDRNTGDLNTGNWNSVNRETGFFNSVQINTVRVFNKECDLERWNNSTKPSFIFFNITEWIEDDTKTEGGYLKTYEYQEAFRKSWDNAEDKREQYELLKALPNYDEDVFEAISGFRPGDLLKADVEEMTMEEVCKALGKNIKIKK